MGNSIWPENPNLRPAERTDGRREVYAIIGSFDTISSYQRGNEPRAAGVVCVGTV